MVASEFLSGNSDGEKILLLMVRRRLEEKNRDYRIAFQCAESFSRLSNPILVRLANIDSNDSSQTEKLLKNFADIFSSATNLSLSIELYLKSLRIGLGLKVPEYHDLWKLYNSLPLAVKQELEKTYNERQNLLPKGKIATLKFAMVLKGDNPPEELISAKINSTDIKSLLTRNSNAFTQWRYIYESIRPGNRYFLINFEFRHLLIVKDAIKEFIQKNDPENPTKSTG